MTSPVFDVTWPRVISAGGCKFLIESSHCSTVARPGRVDRITDCSGAGLGLDMTSQWSAGLIGAMLMCPSVHTLFVAIAHLECRGMEIR